MFTYSTVHVMNAYVDNLCICEDDNNIPKQNVPPPLPVPYPTIYPILVPCLIRYVNTSHFIAIFVDVFHVY